MERNMTARILSIGLTITFAFVICSQANAQSPNKEQKIIGTWTAISDDGLITGTVVFNSDGTVTCDGRTTPWYATDIKIAMALSAGRGTNFRSFEVGGRELSFYDYSISSDGKTIILTGSRGFVLTKK
jgi:hypothetical protein